MNKINTTDIYLMENPDEAVRMECKTEESIVITHARWAGIKPGMRVADMGCGPGKTSAILWDLVQPGGEVVGIDLSPDRIEHARLNYGRNGLKFIEKDVRNDINDLGLFDFIWVRFLLEYHSKEAFDLCRKFSNILKPGGILCLIDLDANSLSHDPIPENLKISLQNLIKYLVAEKNFDPYAGRKLYGYLYDLGFSDIKVMMEPHHLIYGKLNPVDEFNWEKKVSVIAEKSGYGFPEFPDGPKGFYRTFIKFFKDPRRFTYTPMICCRGIRQ